MPAPRIVVDRIEGDVAVLEVGGRTVDVPASLLPEGAREGSELQLTMVASSGDDLKARLDRMQSSSGISDDFTL